MFTGLIDDVGIIERISTTPAGIELRVTCGYADVETGESIAVNGACLTVRETGPGWFTVGAVTTTLQRTAIGSWHTGARVNLERAMKLGDRLGGHFVQGHVDGLGSVARVEREGTALLIDIGVPDDVGELCVLHGSITVDGVSLTVNALPSRGTVQVSIVEFTERHTTLGDLRPGDNVHLEADILGKYVRQLLGASR